MAAGLLKWLREIALATVGVSGISAAAIQGFKHFSDKWLDAKFARRVEELRHAHARELKDLHFKIAALLDRVTKQHAREFEVLPEGWSRLNDAFWQSIQSVSPFQSYPT